MAQAQAMIGAANYAVALKCRQHALISDEPTGVGGKDAGPTPSELLAASLAACTVITLRMYAERKGWPLPTATVSVRYQKRAGELPLMERTLTLPPGLSEEQRRRCAQIAERTPVTLALKSGVEIRTELA